MLFDRVASLVIGKAGGTGRELTGLRIAFDIQKGATESPNKSTVRVWNLSDATKKQIETIGNVVILKAGYAQDIGAATIFSGTVTRSTTTREGVDWITELELRDGFLEFRDTKASVSYPPGTPTRRVVQDLAGKFGLTVRTLPADIGDKEYKNGFAFVGRARDGLTKACEYMGLEWSIQNREVQILAKGGVYRKQAYVLSPTSGLIGSPEPEAKTMTDEAAAREGVTAEQTGVTASIKAGRAAKKLKSGKTGTTGTEQTKLQVQGYQASSLLQPLIEPGGYVQLKTRDIDGEFFRVEEVNHVGDTHGGDWYSELTLRYAK